ncbi:hypothetical protein MKW98_000842 [Papaver atlanticum]|uniref:CASP-like protein n=1 Tax=Papaver atlanticum TaxID=357466 RepID=A0AAD4XCC0_9MAGN|nr:hypothetical protein MKW98_000842 [Papaver atlanticum]
MMNFPGTPGTFTALTLRVLQFSFAAGSIVCITTTPGFFEYTALCYLIASMGLQVIWSFGLALFDAKALITKKILHNLVLVSLFAIGDWVTGMLSLAAASASAGLLILYFRDLGKCQSDCLKYWMSITLAFMSWVMIEISSLIMFWLLAAG